MLTCTSDGIFVLPSWGAHLLVIRGGHGRVVARVTADAPDKNTRVAQRVVGDAVENGADVPRSQLCRELVARVRCKETRVCFHVVLPACANQRQLNKDGGGGRIS